MYLNIVNFMHEKPSEIWNKYDLVSRLLYVIPSVRDIGK